MELDYSIISKIARCPKVYEIDLTVAPSINSAMLLGATFHLIQKTYFTARLAGAELQLSDLLDCFSIYWASRAGAEDKDIIWGKDNPDDLEMQGRELIKAYYPYAQKTEPLLVENRFTRDTPCCLVYGTIDLINTAGSVIDYKTSAWFPTKEELDGGLQPTVYSFLLGGSVDFQLHYILKFRPPVVRIFHTVRNNHDLQFFEKSLLPGVVRMIETGLFPPLGAATGQCKWCLHRGYCNGK